MSHRPTLLSAGLRGARSASGIGTPLGRSSPPARLVDAFDQVVEHLITEITCLRSRELRLVHLVSGYIGSPPGELRTSVPRGNVIDPRAGRGEDGCRG